MKKTVKRNLQKAALACSTTLFAVMLTVTQVAYENKTQVTQFFGVQDFIKYEVESEDGKPVNTEYFDSEYKNIREVVYGGYQIQIEEQVEGTVLLKNDNDALPLAKGNKVSLFGLASAQPFYGASGSGGINTSEAVSWREAFGGIHYEKADPKAKIDGEDLLVVNPKLAEEYNDWTKPSGGGGWGGGEVTPGGPYGASSSTTNVKIGDVPWDVLKEGEGYKDLAAYGDAAIMIIKRTGGEGYDLPATSAASAGQYSLDATSVSVNDGKGGDYLQLSESEIGILEGLKAEKAAGNVKKIILVLNMASTIQLDFLKDDTYGIDACLWTGSVGEFGTIGVAKLLIGEENFSGGASATLWADHLNNPVNSNYSDQNYYFQYDNYKSFNFNEMTESYQSTFTSYMVYQEGMYLGYKYTETRYEDYVMGTQKVGAYNYDDVVAYPFGYGLSYTTFGFSNLKVSKNDKTYTVSVDVKNTGSVAGKTPVQIYVAKPYGEYERTNKIQTPSVELIDFGKTRSIAPGATETVTVEVNEKYFATYDTFGAGTYVLTAGDYYLIAAQNAHEAVNNLLAAKKFTPAGTNNKMDAEGDASLTYAITYAFDDKTYAYSTETGNPIQNSFGFADINTYEGRGDNSVTYYSRDDWEGTVKLSTRDADGTLHKPYVQLKMTQAMADELRNQMDASKVITKGGEDPTYGANNGLALIDLRHVDAATGEVTYEPYNSLLWDQLLDQLTWDETVTLLSQGRHQTTVIKSISKPGTGDENGPNGQSHTYGKPAESSRFSGPKNPYAYRINDPDIENRYSSTGFSSNGVLAATFNKELAAKVGKQIGEEGLWGGTAGLLGTGLNIQRSPYAGRTAEYYSEDAMLSGLIAAPETAATESMGVHCYIKHCAMNESETARHGVQLWTTEQAMRENYLRAFEIAIEEGEAFNVMTSFSRMGVWAVANCVDFAQKFLRHECGLPGIVETDAAGDMTDGAHGEAYVSRICNVFTGATDLNEYNYDNDFPDYTGSSVTYANFAPGSGYGALGQRMREAAKRICYATLTSNAMCGTSSNTRFEKIMVPWEYAVISIDVVLGVLTAASLVWIVADTLLGKKKKNG